MSRVASRYLIAVMAALVATGSLSLRPSPVAAAGTISLATIGVAYTQDFDTLAITGTTNTTLPLGWDLLEGGGGARDNEQYAFDDGGSTTGDVYSYGTDGSTERAFGTLQSGSLVPTIGASFTNNTGSTITSFNLAYTGEMWRAGVVSRGAADRLDFQLSTDATSLGTGVWADVNAADFSSPNTSSLVNQLDGNAVGNRTTIVTPILGVSIPDGATFWIRWSDFDITSSDDGLAVDDFSITPLADNVRNLAINNVSANEGDSVPTSFDFTVSLTAPAGPGGVTLDIATSDGTATVADNDYTAKALTGQTIPAGTSTYTFSVDVNADTTAELDETFFVDVSNVSGADVADGQGQGTIVDDDTDVCTLAYTPIYQIQGSGLATPIPGNVTTQGVVVGDFQGLAAMSGFFLQDAAGDGDAATSDGIFVFTGANDNGLAAGDVVRVTGYARERFANAAGFGMTSLNGSNSNSTPVTDIVDCDATASIAPTDVTMPFASSTFLEQYEGMLVRFPQPLVIAEYFNYDQFGEIVLALPLDGETRPFTPTAVEEPGPDALQRAQDNLLRRITLDDNQAGRNPIVLRHPNGDPFALDNLFRGGDLVTDTTGVLNFDFDLYRVQPTTAATYTPTNPRPEAPEPVGGRLEIAAMNTLNFFLTLDTTASDSGPGPCGANQNLDCRGADASQPLEFGRQRTKLLQALAGLDADVIGLNEIENTPGVSPLGDETNGVVAGLNAMPNVGPFDFIDTGVIGTDAIRVGLIFRSDVVEPVGDFKVLTTVIDPRFIDTKSRPALAQTFEEKATGERFTVVVNHLKSKGSSCDDVGDPIDPNGQGNCNGTRTAAAQALVDWIATDPTGSGDPDFLIMGDLNSYAMEDPVTAIKAGADDTAGTADDWANLIAKYQLRFAYSYTFDGQAGYLDHSLANASLVGQVTGAADWHINSDEPDVVDYDTSFKPPEQEALYEPIANRSSDHDPVKVGLELNAPPTIAVAGGGTCSTSGATVLVAVDDLQVDPTLTFGESSNTALVPNDGVTVLGSGATRSIVVNPVPRRSGTAVLSFTLSDGVNFVPFTLTVKVGTDLADTLTGTAGADLLIGLQGDDSLSGMGDGDLLCGGNGNDTLAGGDGIDTLDGDRGDDILGGGAGDDVLRGGQGDDTLTGGAGADEFSGGSGVDVNVDLTPTEGDTWDGT